MIMPYVFKVRGRKVKSAKGTKCGTAGSNVDCINRAYKSNSISRMTAAVRLARRHCISADIRSRIVIRLRVAIYHVSVYNKGHIGP